MARKAKKAQNESPYYYLCGVLIGVVLICIFYSLHYLFLLQDSPIFSAALSSSQLTYNNPKKLNIPILMYHYVEFVQDRRDTIRQTLDILPPVFENQIVTLKQAGFTFLTPKDLNSILDNHMPLPKKPIILSFDDGYGDFYTDVFPILKKEKVRAVAYVISGVLDQPNYMTKKQLNEVIKTNLVEIGCHTVTHPDLRSLSHQDADFQIGGCKRELSQNFGVTPISFAYPYGFYNESLFPILAKYGFLNSTTTAPGTEISRTNLYEIPRLRPGGRVGSDLTSYIEYEVNQNIAQNPFVANANASEKKVNLGE